MKLNSLIIMLAISTGFVACTKENTENNGTATLSLQLKNSSLPVTDAQIVVSGAEDSLYCFEKHLEDGTYNGCTSHSQHHTMMNGNGYTIGNMMADSNYIAGYTRIGNCNYYGKVSADMHSGMHQNLSLVLDSCDASLKIRCMISGNSGNLSGIDIVLSTTDIGMTSHHGETETEGTHKGGYCRYGGNSNPNGLTQFTNLVPGYYYYDCSYEMMDHHYRGHGKIEVKPGTHQEVIVNMMQ